MWHLSRLSEQLMQSTALGSAAQESEMLNIVGHLSDDGLMGKGVLTYAAQATLRAM